MFSNLLLYKICITNGYNRTECNSFISSRGDNTTIFLEETLQSQATIIIMVKSVIEGLFPAIISLFLGPWSDINGRKPLIFSSLIGKINNSIHTFFGFIFDIFLYVQGFLFYYIVVIGYVLFDDLNPWYLVLASIPYSLTGGTSSIITGSFCYVSDITTSNNRSSR